MGASVDLGGSKQSEFLWLLAGIGLMILACFIPSCQRKSVVCPEGSVSYFMDVEAVSALSPPELPASPLEVEIDGKMTEVDRVIHGPICSDTWEGTIYVACDIQIAEWTDAPRFFEDCPLTIKPDTKVYVASHNDAVYYKGCSCHTGELVQLNP